MGFSIKFALVAAWKHLLRLLCHHQHQIKVVCSQRVLVEVIDIHEEEKVLQSFFSADRTRTFRTLHWTPKAHSHTLWIISRVKPVSSPRSSWTFCRAISNSGTVFFTWDVSMDRKYLEKKTKSHCMFHLIFIVSWTRDSLFKRCSVLLD